MLVRFLLSLAVGLSGTLVACAPAPVVDFDGSGAPVISWPSGPVHEIRVFRNDVEGNRESEVWRVVCSEEACINSPVTVGRVPVDTEEVVPIGDELTAAEYEVQTVTLEEDGTQTIFSDHFVVEETIQLESEREPSTNPLAELLRVVLDLG